MKKRTKKVRLAGAARQYRPSTPPSQAEAKTARPQPGRRLAELPPEPMSIRMQQVRARERGKVRTTV